MYELFITCRTNICFRIDIYTCNKNNVKRYINTSTILYSYKRVIYMLIRICTRRPYQTLISIVEKKSVVNVVVNLSTFKR